MIKAKEFRIGNYVQDSEGNIGTASMITKMSVDVLSDSGRHNNILMSSDEINPISITEDWLLKMGFEKKHNMDGEFIFEIIFQIDKFYLEYMVFNNHTYTGYYYYSDSTNEGHKLYKYVHQLQNLYFALTGKELEIKVE